MKYWQAIKLSSREFKRLTGVKRQTFRLMIRLIKAQEKQKKKPGRPTKLIIEDRVLVTLHPHFSPQRRSVKPKSLLHQGLNLVFAPAVT